jgi:type I restriction enzyme M protein
MNKQELAAKIWQSANKMRSKIEANEYKDYILGFIFYMFLSNKEVEYFKGEGWTEDDMKYDLHETNSDMPIWRSTLGYFIDYNNLFGTWINEGSDFTVDNVTTALNAFERNIDPTHQKVFVGIFKTLETGLTKLGDGSQKQTQAIRDLIDLIKDIPTDEKQDYDVLGFIYEYLISNFAANAGKKAGEFYTPHEASVLMSEIIADYLKGREKIEIYDPTSGSGSLLINIGSCVAKHIKEKNRIKYYAQELKENTFNLTRMNLVMHGILPDNIVVRNGDTLADDWPYFEDNDKEKTYHLLRVDAVVANPPYSQAWIRKDMDSDPRFKYYGLAPAGKADYAFLLHNLYHTKPDGIMTIVLPHGVLFRGGDEEKIRTNLIEKNNIETIIGLPANIFFGTGIPTIIMVLKPTRSNTDVLFIDASKGFEKDGNKNKLRARDIKRIVDTVIAREKGDGKFSRLVTRDEIRKNGYNLNIPRYVDSSDPEEPIDIYSTMYGGIPNEEIELNNSFWNVFPSLKTELFKKVDSHTSVLAAVDIKKTIYENKDVKTFLNKCDNVFAGFNSFLENRLLSDFCKINVPLEEETISEEIFRRSGSIPLVDKYSIYQSLDDVWKVVSRDLEIIQTEGAGAIRKVDPNMVTKKKGDKEVQVQEGYLGRIVPFDLAQSMYLAAAKQSLEAKQERLADIATSYTDIIDSIDDEDKGDFLNEDKTKFDFPELEKLVKDYRGNYPEDSLEAKLLQANKLNKEEKNLKKSVKIESSELEKTTIEFITHLSEEQIKALLVKKWIEPILNSIKAEPTIVLDGFAQKMDVLSKKYEVTLAHTEADIDDTEKELISMLGMLTAKDPFDLKGIEELKKILQGKDHE